MGSEPRYVLTIPGCFNDLVLSNQYMHDDRLDYVLRHHTFAVPSRIACRRYLQSAIYLSTQATLETRHFLRNVQSVIDDWREIVSDELTAARKAEELPNCTSVPAFSHKVSTFVCDALVTYYTVPLMMSYRRNEYRNTNEAETHCSLMKFVVACKLGNLVLMDISYSSLGLYIKGLSETVLSMLLASVMVAALKGQWNAAVVFLLQQKEFDPNVSRRLTGQPAPVLAEATCSSNLCHLSSLLQPRFRIASHGKNYEDAVRVAGDPATSDNLTKLEMLLTHASPEDRDRLREKAFCRACCDGRLEVVQLLSKLGYVEVYKTSASRTGDAMGMAVIRNHLHIVKWLLSLLDQSDLGTVAIMNSLRAALLHASNNENTEMLAFLLEHNIWMSAADKYNFAASIEGGLAAVDHHLHADAISDSPSLNPLYQKQDWCEFGQDVLRRAVCTQRLENVEIALSRGAKNTSRLGFGVKEEVYEKRGKQTFTSINRLLERYLIPPAYVMQQNDLG